MITKILLTAALLLPSLSFACSPGATSELVNYNTDKSEIQKATYCNNWFISVGAGEQLLAYENSKVLEVGDHIIPSHDVTVSKWLNPGIGIRAMFCGLSLQGCQIKEDFNSFPLGARMMPDLPQQMNLHADILFNASHLVVGYNEQRVWNVIPYTDYTPTQALNDSSAGEHTSDLHFPKQFRNNQMLNINLNIEGIFVGNHLLTDEMPQKDGFFSATLALTYSLPNQKTEKVNIPLYHDKLWGKYSKEIQLSQPNALHLTQQIATPANEVPSKD